MRLLREFKERGFTSEEPTTKIHCKFYEDNSGDLEMAKEIISTGPEQSF